MTSTRPGHSARPADTARRVDGVPFDRTTGSTYPLGQILTPLRGLAAVARPPVRQHRQATIQLI